MNDLHNHHRRLCELADCVCDGRLDEATAAELQQLIKNDDAAAEVFAQYLELHSNLFWDLGILPSTPLTTQDANSHEDSTAPLKELMDDLLTEAALNQDVTPHRTHEKQTRRTLYQPAKMLTVCLAIFLTLGTGLLWWNNSSPAPGSNIVENNSAVDSLADAPQAVSPLNPANSEEDPAFVENELPPELPKIDWDHPPLKSQPITVNVVEGSPTQAPVEVLGVAYSNDQDVINSINERISLGWKDWQVQPSAKADDYEWVRRVYLDLAGRIPTEAELNTYLNNSSEQRDQELVDQLIDSPAFALQWSTTWTRLLVGRAPNERVDRLALQKYLHGVAELNRSWSNVVEEMIAAKGNPHQNGAANFLVAHLNNQAVPATAFVAKTLMGYQIQCSQCHHHPFYALSQKEFWELNSFFKQAVVTQVDQPQEAAPSYLLQDRPTAGPTYYETRFGVMHAAFPKYNGQEVIDDEKTSRREQLADLLTAGEDPLIAQAFVNRTWSMLFGYGFTQPVDDLGPHNPATHPELFSTLSRSFVACDYDIKRLYRWICLSEPYRLSSQMIAENREDNPSQGTPPAFSRMYFKSLSPEQLYDSLQAVAGELDERNQQWPQHVTERDQWVSQFVSSYENDENDEEDHFDGTISQALVLMNGNLVDQTIHTEKNVLLKDLVNKSISDQKKFERICLTVLSRKPRPQEVALFRQIQASLRDVKSPVVRQELLASRLSDLLWAYLNSSEFIVNH